MRSRKPSIIIWPQYFDVKRTRAQGRRIAKKFALEKVSAPEISNLISKLGYEVHYEKGYKYPKSWWDEPGRIIVDTKGKSKSKFLIEIAKELKKTEIKR